MNPALPDPAQWFSGLFKPQTDLLHPAAWQTLWDNAASLQQEYVKQLTTLWPALGMMGSMTAADGEPQDKRFSGTAWQADPRFQLTTRSYQAYATMLNRAIDACPLDDQAKQQWSFAARQLVDALSPANFLATNPEAMQLVVESGGKSLVDGMGLLVADLLKGRITMTDEEAFELGRNIATTPGAVIFENEVMQLIRYTPVTDKVYTSPLLMVPPCINKFYILDLQAENSLVRFALEQGHQVFLVSWRNATAAIDGLSWDDYLQQGVTAAIDTTLEASVSDSLNTLGFCMGGTLLSCAVAVMKPAERQRVSSLTLLTTMLDFVDTGELGLLVTEQSVAQREAAIGSHGLMKGSELALTFSSLRANDLIWPYVVNGYLKGKAPPAFDLLYWNSDATNLPGPMYCWYLRNTYLSNKLKEPGQTVQNGVPLDLGRLDMPAYLYASREDHIVPWRTAYASAPLLGGDVTFTLGASGHIAGVINPASKNKRNHWTGVKPAGDLAHDADAWLDAATSVPGSWWPHWANWLTPLAGAKIVAPKTPARGRFAPIEPAPGRYVKEKAE